MANFETSHYTYHSVNSTDEEIRLVTIKAGSGPKPVQCTLTHASLRDLPQYEALSYVWGDSAIRQEIFLECYSFSVTRNLGQALWYLRLADKDRTFWIDAICINQNDVAERSAQVQLMRRIYHDAQQVVSWIDEGKVQAADAIELISEARSHGFSTSWAQEKLLADGGERRKFIYVVLMMSKDCQYWCRLWITQEVALARKGIVQCKTVTIPYEDFKSFSQMFTSAVEISGPMIDAFDVGDYVMLIDIAKDAASSDIVKGNVPGTDLLALLKNNRSKGATDPRDKVYGLFGLAGVDSNSHHGLKIDYSEQWTKSDVYTGVVQAVVQTTSKLDIICESHPMRPESDLQDGHSDPENDLPSWVPDWTNSKSARYTDLDVSNGGAARDTPASAGFLANGTILSAAGICVGTVGKLGSTVTDLIGRKTRRHLEDAINALVDWYTLVKGVNDSSFASINVFSRTILLGQEGDVLNTLLLAELNGELDFKNPNSRYRKFVEVVATGILRNFKSSRLFLIEATKNDPTAKVHELPIMGMGPRVVEEDDMVCVFFGCRYPVVIRPDGDRFRFVSAVYVDTLMAGQAIEDLENGFYDLMTFEMH